MQECSAKRNSKGAEGCIGPVGRELNGCTDEMIDDFKCSLRMFLDIVLAIWIKLREVVQNNLGKEKK